jgi:hypothetical protein
LTFPKNGHSEERSDEESLKPGLARHVLRDSSLPLVAQSDIILKCQHVLGNTLPFYVILSETNSALKHISSGSTFILDLYKLVTTVRLYVNLVDTGFGLAFRD